jgi:FeS assembly protein IscX
MKWTDTRDIALALVERHPNVNPRNVRFTDLRQWILELPGFADDPAHCGEKILEAVQMTWMEEAD